MPEPIPYVMVSGNPKAHISAAHRRRIEKGFRERGLHVSISPSMVIDPLAPTDQVIVMKDPDA